MTAPQPPPIVAKAQARSSKKPPSAAQVIVGMALAQYDFRVDKTGEVYALPTDEDAVHIARPLRGGTLGLRQELSRQYREATGRVATSSALSDALTALEGEAATRPHVELYLRVARTKDAIYLDMANDEGEAVEITAEGWNIVADPPVWFRRSEATLPLPYPESGGSFDALWSLVNVDEEDRPLILTAEVASLFPNISHVIVFMLAEFGSGKTTAVRVLAGLLDPSYPDVQKPPENMPDWVVAAKSATHVAVDNISTFPVWLSDALCRAVTGEGVNVRKYYTNGDSYVVSFRRCLWLTSTQLSGLREDMASRTVLLALRRITEETRLLEEELLEQWAEAHPAVLGALLDLTVSVLAVLPEIPKDHLPRMADFARILRAVDAVMGTKGEARYRDTGAELSRDLVEHNSVGQALLSRIPDEGVHFVTAGELLPMLSGHWALMGQRLPNDWPASPKALSDALTALQQTLTAIGWEITNHGRGGKGKTLRWSLRPPEPDGSW